MHKSTRTNSSFYEERWYFPSSGTGFLFSESVSSQPTDQVDAGGHEKWEYWLEGFGDALQIALPLTALSITLIEGDSEGTKQFAYSYEAPWYQPIL